MEYCQVKSGRSRDKRHLLHDCLRVRVPLSTRHGLQLEVAFTGRTEAGKHHAKLSLEPLKVTTRRFEPCKRGHDGEVVRLPSLEPAMLLDSDKQGENTPSNNADLNSSDSGGSGPQEDGDVRAAWQQAYGLVLPAGPLKLTSVALRGDGNAEDGGLLSW